MSRSKKLLETTFDQEKLRQVVGAKTLNLADHTATGTLYALINNFEDARVERIGKTLQITREEVIRRFPTKEDQIACLSGLPEAPPSNDLEMQISARVVFRHRTVLNPEGVLQEGTILSTHANDRVRVQTDDIHPRDHTPICRSVSQKDIEKVIQK